jgi:hypothetical protein
VIRGLEMDIVKKGVNNGKRYSDNISGLWGAWYRDNFINFFVGIIGR